MSKRYERSNQLDVHGALHAVSEQVGKIILARHSDMVGDEHPAPNSIQKTLALFVGQRRSARDIERRGSIAVVEAAQRDLKSTLQIVKPVAGRPDACGDDAA